MNAHTPESRLRFREALESEVERLLSLLDGLDPDPDLEETGDEHDTGAAGNWMNPHPYACGDQLVILEDDEESDPGEESDHVEDDGSAEPYLGWSNPTLAALGASKAEALRPFPEGWTGHISDSPDGPLGFDGSGHAEGRRMLHGRRKEEESNLVLLFGNLR
jgi:hypothetical protein